MKLLVLVSYNNYMFILLQSRDNAWFHFSGGTNIVCSMYRMGCIIYLIIEYILFSFCSHTLGSIDPWF